MLGYVCFGGVCGLGAICVQLCMIRWDCMLKSVHLKVHFHFCDLGVHVCDVSVAEHMLGVENWRSVCSDVCKSMSKSVCLKICKEGVLRVPD